MGDGEYKKYQELARRVKRNNNIMRWKSIIFARTYGGSSFEGLNIIYVLYYVVPIKTLRTKTLINHNSTIVGP